MHVLAANQTTDFRTLADYYKQCLPDLAGLVLQVLNLCERTRLVKLGHVVLDCAKVYRDMQRRRPELRQEVEAAPDRQCGITQRGDERPAELAFRGGRLQKKDKAMSAMAAERKWLPS